MMKNRNLTVLLADRNPRIRDYILRELRSDGYHVITAKNGDQLIKWLDSSIRLDVLILDPNMPGIDSEDQLELLLLRKPNLLIVFHCLALDHPQMSSKLKKRVLVEKTGNSIDGLKQQLKLLLQRSVLP